MVLSAKTVVVVKRMLPFEKWSPSTLRGNTGGRVGWGPPPLHASGCHDGMAESSHHLGLPPIPGTRELMTRQAARNSYGPDARSCKGFCGQGWITHLVPCKNSMPLKSLEGRKHYPLHDNLQQCTRFSTNFPFWSSPLLAG
jgi:hypothetical protein